jgi:hypothetical protein
MDLPSLPAAPWLACTRCHASSMLSRESIGSRSVACVPPCFPADSSGPSTRPYGVCVADRGSGGESHPTGLGLGAPARALLGPLLTPPASPRRFPVVPLPIRGVPGWEVSPAKNAHGNGTPSACTLGPAPGASGCGATSPGPLAFEAVAVRRRTVVHSGFLPTVGPPPAVAFGSYVPYAPQGDHGGSRPGDFNPLSSRPCWAYTKARSGRPTAHVFVMLLVSSPVGRRSSPALI